MVTTEELRRRRRATAPVQRVQERTIQPKVQIQQVQQIEQVKQETQVDYQKAWNQALNIYNKGHTGMYLRFMKPKGRRPQQAAEVSTIRAYLSKLIKMQKVGDISPEEGLLHTPEEVRKQKANIEFFKPKEPKFVGPVRPGVSEKVFRETGRTEWKKSEALVPSMTPMEKQQEEVRRQKEAIQAAREKAAAQREELMKRFKPTPTPEEPKKILQFLKKDIKHIETKDIFAVPEHLKQSRFIPPRITKKTLKQRFAEAGAATTLIEKIGEIFEEGEKAKQLSSKIIKDITRKKLGIILPKDQIEKIKDIIIEQKTGVSKEERLIAKQKMAKMIGETAPFFIPVVGGILAATAAAESVTKPRGKKEIKNTQEWLRQKGYPKQLAYIPPLILAVGGAAVLRSEIRAANKLATISKEGDTVVTSAFSPNIKDVQVRKVLSNLDNEAIKVVGKNKLSAARVYETKVNGKTITFVEFSKGGIKGDGFMGSRYIYGVELDKKGRVISRIGGLSIEKVGKDKVSRSITELIKTTRKRGMFSVKPREQKELIRFAQESKSKRTDIVLPKEQLPTAIITTEAKTRLISKKPLKFPKRDLKVSEKEAQEFLRFLEVGDKKVGKLVAKGKGISVEKLQKLELEFKQKLIKSQKLREEKMVGKAIEVSKFETRAVKDIPKKEVIGLKQKQRSEIKTIRKNIPSKLKGEFDKLSSIEKNYYTGQRLQNKLNPKSGITKGGLRKILTEKKEAGLILIKKEKAKIISIDKVPKKVTRQVPSDIAGAYAVITKEQKKIGSILTKLKGIKAERGIIAKQVQKSLAAGRTIEEALLKKAGKGVKEDIRVTAKDIILETKPVTITKKIFRVPTIRPTITRQIPAPTLKPIILAPTKPIPPIVPAITKTKVLKTVKPKPKRLTPKQQFYIPEAKRNNKWVKLAATGLTKQAAEGRGARAVDNTIAGRFRIRKVAKGSPKIIDNYFAYNKKKFRGYKIVKGEKIPMQNKFIEKRGPARIDSRGEKQGLTLAKLIKQKDWLGKKAKKKKVKAKKVMGIKIRMPAGGII